MSAGEKKDSFTSAASTEGKYERTELSNSQN